MYIPIVLIVIAIILFLAKSRIPNSDLERLANIVSIIIFAFGVISLFLPLPPLITNVLFEKQSTPEIDSSSTDSGLSMYEVPLGANSFGSCEFKEMIAYFDKDESLSVEYTFPSGFFSKPVASHVDFFLNGPDFEDGFRVDEVLTYSITHKVVVPGEYRVGFFWRGAYFSEVHLKLPTKNWQIVVSDCPNK